MEEANNGITLREIFKTIWLKKWVALIVAVAVALIVAVALYYGYNHTVKTYEVEFSLNLPGDDNSAFYSYPDGKQFYYADMTSATTLKEIKANGDFSGVNVDEMVKKGRIGIRREITVTPLSTDGSSFYKETVYTVSVKAKYFSDKNEAKEFLTSIANYPAVHLENMEIDYNVYLPLAKKAAEAGKNDTAIKYLDEQLKFLSGKYKNLKDTYGDTFVVGSGKTLLACAEEIAAYSVNAEDLETSITTVENFTTSFRTTSKAVYAKATSVAFVQPNIIVERGEMSLVKVLILSVIVAVIIALVAAYVAGYRGLKKKNASGETPSNVPSVEQPAAEPEASEKQNKE